VSWKIGTGIRTKLLKIGLPEPPLPKVSPANGTLAFHTVGYNSSLNSAPLPADGWLLRWWYGSTQWSSVNLSHGWGHACAYLTGPPDDFRVLTGVATVGWCEPAPVPVESYWLKENELGLAAPIQDYVDQQWDKQTFNWDGKPGSKEDLEARTRAALESGSYPMLNRWYAHLLEPDNYPDPTTTEEQDHRCDVSAPPYKNRGGNASPDPYLPQVPTAFSSTARPSGAVGAPDPYLRHGRTEWGREYIDRWPGWGWRHIQAKHGWSPIDEAASRAALETPATTVEQSPTSMRYEGAEYQQNGAVCRRVVIVEYGVQEGDPAGTPKGIITSYGESVQELP
jgi:hypothetical protein